jgi:tyrosinase
VQPGANTITRRSQDSTLTAPWPLSVQQVRSNIENGLNANVNCECGFPHHLLLPRGTEQGMSFDVFVMLTDASVDIVQQGSNGQQQGQFGQQCIPSHIHCGILGQPYPDAKPMGYPFDRRPYAVPISMSPAAGPTGNPPITQLVPVPNIEAYVANVPNMATVPVSS